MMNEDWKLDGHERFKELGALVNTGALTSAELLQLESHLHISVKTAGKFMTSIDF
jgi:hypothetical protein